MTEDLFKRLEEEVTISCEGSAFIEGERDCPARATLVVFINHIPDEDDEDCDTLIAYVCYAHAITIDVILAPQLRSTPCELCGGEMATLADARQRQSLVAPEPMEE